MVANFDWSQGHAAKPADGHSAEDANVNPGGKQPHMRPTSWPMGVIRSDGTLVPRIYYCSSGCMECARDLEKFETANPTAKQRAAYQAVGRKGLKQMCIERGFWRPGMKQADMVAALQECDDFSPKLAHERTRVCEMMKEAGHVALFGVKYHAELAWIERKSQGNLKRQIRSQLNGKMKTLEKALKKAWPCFGLDDARKAARHCRDTMRAYVSLGKDISLDKLEEAQKEQKSHRRVVDAIDGKLKQLAEIKLTEAQKRNVAKMQTQRATEKILAPIDALKDSE